ncbi:MAG: hypothetical protein QT10_C0012G0015 [archaeon GW2011_AR19]|nr:MAG: hypothetical protein QT10_C0012G0015 [archaeon GW2011_AR19]
MKIKRGKKAQLTIFIIVAIVVVAIVALLFAIPKLRTAVGFEKPESPENFIQTCLEDTIKENVELISLQGGSLEPSPSILYQDIELQFLCYTNEDLKPCVTQIPFLKEHIEDEIKKSIEEDVDFCFKSLRDTYVENNYVANFKPGKTIVELLPQRIVTTMDYEFTSSKADETQRRETFRVILNNNLYELTAIAQNILNWETRYGDADCDYYMDLYSEIKCEKPKRTTDGTIYVITNKATDDKFQFASRSLIIGPFG